MTTTAVKARASKPPYAVGFYVAALVGFIAGMLLGGLVVSGAFFTVLIAGIGAGAILYKKWQTDVWIAVWLTGLTCALALTIRSVALSFDIFMVLSALWLMGAIGWMAKDLKK